jgi:hypothetical protein
MSVSSSGEYWQKVLQTFHTWLVWKEAGGGRHDTQHNDIQRKDIQHDDTQHYCNLIKYDIQHDDTQLNAEHWYAECPVMLSVIYKPYMLSIVMLGVVILTVGAPEGGGALSREWS